MTDIDTRDTQRVFYPPKERFLKTPAKDYEDRLVARVAELEEETARLTARLYDREQELLEALDLLEEAGML